MNWAISRQQRRALLRENRDQPQHLTEVPREVWPNPDVALPLHLTRVWRSAGFLVQQYEEPGAPVRLSINRTEMRPDGRWADGITWDEIQALKAQAGYAERYAVELFPAAADLVDVANVRHIWLLDEPPAWAWRRP